MNWRRTNIANLTSLGRSAAFVFVIIAVATLAIGQSSAQTMQKGISVQLAPTSNAVSVPDADKQDALIVTVTDAGKLYFGIDPVTSNSLAEALKARHARNVYIKADARAPYAFVVKVLDAASAADITTVTLLTTRPDQIQAGAARLPHGIEMELARHAPAVTK